MTCRISLDQRTNVSAGHYHGPAETQESGGGPGGWLSKMRSRSWRPGENNLEGRNLLWP